MRRHANHNSGNAAACPEGPGLTLPVLIVATLGRASFVYNLDMNFDRITIDPAVCTGKPCIRGLRFPVARLLGLLAAGESREQILMAYPYLETEDIDTALRYAAFLAEDETVELAAAG